MIKERKNILSIAAFLAGAAAGTAATLLFATHGGKVFRQILKNDTNLLISEAAEKKNRILRSVKETTEREKNLISGYLKKPFELFNQEIYSIKEGLNAAVIAYTRAKNTEPSQDVTETYINEDIEELDNLPKLEGMRRRSDHERFS